MQSILSTSLLLSFLYASPLVLTASPDDLRHGHVHGHIGATTQNVRGDTLTSTFCYCAADKTDKTQDANTLAHYYQFEYYNSHKDYTFLMDDKCTSTSIEHDSACGISPRANRQGSGPLTEAYHGWYPTHKNGLCRTWPGTWPFNQGTHGRNDTLCYTPNVPRGKKVKDGFSDFVLFNGQRRDVGRNGRQGYTVMDAGEVRTFCDDLCRDFMHMEVAEGEASRQVVDLKVDDMCPGCA